MKRIIFLVLFFSSSAFSVTLRNPAKSKYLQLVLNAVYKSDDKEMLEYSKDIVIKQGESAEVPYTTKFKFPEEKARSAYYNGRTWKLYKLELKDEEENISAFMEEKKLKSDSSFEVKIEDDEIKLVNEIKPKSLLATLLRNIL